MMRSVFCLTVSALIIGVLGLYFSGSEAVSRLEEMEMIHLILKEKGLTGIKCEGFYWAQGDETIEETGAMKKMFENLGFQNISYTRENGSKILRGKLSSGTEGAYMVSRVEDGKVFVGFKISDDNPGKVREILERAVVQLSARTVKGATTWSLKGTITYKMDNEEMIAWASELLSHLKGHIEIEQFAGESLNILASSSLLKAGPDVGEKMINLNLILKTDSCEEATRIYLGVPFVSGTY